MEESALRAGLSGQIAFRVEEAHLAQNMGSSDARVLATPMLVAGMERAAMAAVRNALAPGETSVGVHVDISHDAGTPLGMTVTFEATLTAIEGRKLKFEVKAWDEAGPAGKGSHERVIVNKEKFEAKIQSKSAG